MATKTLYFTGIKSGWYVSYFFQALGGYGYTVTLQDDTGHTYVTWEKASDGSDSPNRYTNSFWYEGSDGKLICTIYCSESSHLDNTWAESIITPSSGKPTLGRTYCAAFEDNGGIIEYNNVFISLVGWSQYHVV
ncbi:MULTISPECIES: hypothetical protein [Xenorhabdus]|uniref:hypothetical protein n=1 Tax=Xenorhabdus TaxID=626 RepID=UPI00064B08F6|nr:MULTISPECIES: hypothetical protein [Xenorhabdus]KLU14295.1 hypothetical protein AAY47_17260 [Xenorhabdus griffiniae]KOP33797.1 hypothetical protein AFK69_07995 [Xenorhabdus sp. GDc328]